MSRRRLPVPTTIGQRELVVMVAFIMSLQAFTIDGMLPALSDMANELGASQGNQRQLVIGVFMIMAGVGSLVPGSLADRYGRRPVLLAALASYTVLSAAVVFVHSFTVLLAIRGLQGFLAAGLAVVPNAIVRDKYSGDRMAKLMSMVAAIFIIVPVIAPTIGQGILLFAGWRWIFVLLAALGGLAGLWVYLRLPETLDRADVQPIAFKVIVGNMREALLKREATGYVLGQSLLIGAVFGYVNSSQQLIGEHFGAGEWFALIYGATAATLALSNLINSRIVERFGARRVSHAGVLAFIAVSTLQVWAAFYRDGSLAWFAPLMAINLGLLGFLGANFGSIAMQPFRHIAGAASSVQSFFRMFGAAIVGLLIGQAYDGTAVPFTVAMLASSVAALMLVMFSERGKLFRRLHGRVTD